MKLIIDIHDIPRNDHERWVLERGIPLEQEPKTGHWIADVDKWGDVVTTINGYRCNKCNAFNSDKDNYCPNCGADMKEEQDEK